MHERTAPQDLVDRAEVSPAVLALRPDYRAVGAEPPVALFTPDARGLLTADALAAAADELRAHLSRLGRDVRAARRLVDQP